MKIIYRMSKSLSHTKKYSNVGCPCFESAFQPSCVFFFKLNSSSTPVLGVKSDAFFQLVFDWKIWKGGVSKGHSRAPIPACVNRQLCHSNSLASCQAVGVTRQKGSHGNFHFAILVRKVGVNQGGLV